MNNDWFFEKFALIADAPGAVARMRQLILTLAIQGKLVPQDPEDESAQELISRVISEKLRLVQSKEIKDESHINAIADDEVFGIPSNWVWCRAGALSKPISSGSTPEQHVFHPSEGIPYLKVYNIQNQKVDFEYKPQFITISYHREKMKRSRLVPGDVVMNIVGPPLGKVAIIPDRFPEWNCNQAISFFRPVFPELAPWIYTFLKEGSFLRNIQLIGTAGQDNISVTKCKFIPIAIPPLAEQKRIVAKVDELLGLCDALESQQQERELRKSVLVRSSLSRFAESPTPENLGYLFHKSYDIPPSELRKSILTLAVQGKLVPQDPNDEPASSILEATQSFFKRLVAEKKLSEPKPLPRIDDQEEPFSLPLGWEWCRLGHVIRISSGDGLTANDMVDGPFPVFGGNGVNGYHNQGNVSKRTLVIGRVGFYCGSIHITPAKAWVTDNAFITTFNDEHLDLDFLRWLLKATDLRKRDNATAQPVISGAKIYPTILGLPPLAEQRRIVAKVDQLMALVDELERQQDESRKKASNFLDAIVQEMTSGGRGIAATLES
jgi:type I restriction enzyme S subunit